jgi:CHAD domain-containing protein
MKPARIQQFVRAQAVERLKKLDTELRRATKKPEDPATIHDLRVAIRRFTQCVRTFAPFFPAAPRKEIRRRLRKLMDRCGAARNYDIALDLLRQARLRDDALVTHLEAERRRAEKQLVRRLGAWRKREIARRWQKDLRIVSISTPASGWDWEQDAAHNARHVLPGLAAGLFTTGDHAAAAGATHNTIHEFRLQTKRFRYTLELFQPLYGAELERGLNALRGLQDKLGLINDCVTTLELVEGHRRAVIAIGKLLPQCEMEFRLHWKRHFGRSARTRWITWLGRPTAAGQNPNPESVRRLAFA